MAGMGANPFPPCYIQGMKDGRTWGANAVALICAAVCLAGCAVDNDQPLRDEARRNLIAECGAADERVEADIKPPATAGDLSTAMNDSRKCWAELAQFDEAQAEVADRNVRLLQVMDSPRRQVSTLPNPADIQIHPMEPVPMPTPLPTQPDLSDMYARPPPPQLNCLGNVRVSPNLGTNPCPSP